MKCDDCDGTGIGSHGKACFMCNGTKAMCDICGEAVDEEGQNVCNECEEDE